MHDAPLLAPHISTQTPESFQAHVRSLFEKWERAKDKERPPPRDVVISRAKKAIIFRIRREPRWISPAELEAWGAALKEPINQMWAEARRRKIHIWSPEEAQRIIKERGDLPW